jgi:SAM-dependent methyltransferase
MLAGNMGVLSTLCRFSHDGDRWQTLTRKACLVSPEDLIIALVGSLCRAIVDSSQIADIIKQIIRLEDCEQVEHKKVSIYRCLMAFPGHVILCHPDAATDLVRLGNLLTKAKYKRIVIEPESLRIEIKERGAELLDDDPQEWPFQILRALHSLAGYQKIDEIAPVERIKIRIEELWKIGELVPPIGTDVLGLLGRNSPVCPDFGFSRGSPVDRYYLDRFLASHMADFRGRVLDVGASKRRPAASADRMEIYLTVDNDPRMAPDVVGDVHEPDLFAANSFDCILLLNVLEHCHHPQVVVNNALRWLSNGGVVLVAIPNAQRIHPGPLDCWRILPDGCQILFGHFDQVQITTFGNCASVVGSLVGLAAEDISPEILDSYDAAYPVLTCVRASKMSSKLFSWRFRGVPKRM